MDIYGVLKDTIGGDTEAHRRLEKKAPKKKSGYEEMMEREREFEEKKKLKSKMVEQKVPRT